MDYLNVRIKYKRSELRSFCVGYRIGFLYSFYFFFNIFMCIEEVEKVKSIFFRYFCIYVLNEI